MDDDMPPQRGVVYDLKQHQQDALKNLREMRAYGYIFITVSCL